MSIECLISPNWRANSYVSGRILFDCGQPVSVYEKYKDSIEIIVITHCHYDHILSLKETAKVCGAEIYIHELDAAGLTDENYSLSGAFNAVSPNVTADKLLHDGDRIDNFEVIHTPGHSKGGICLYDRESESKDLISGDTVFSSGAFGRFDFNNGNKSALTDSLSKLSKLDVGAIYSGHGFPAKSGGNMIIRSALEDISFM